MAANILHGKLERGKTIVNYVQMITLKSRLHGKALQVTTFSTTGCSSQVYLVSRHIPDRTQRWRWRSCFAVQQQKCFIKFWAINKTEVPKIDIEVEVSAWLWLD